MLATYRLPDALPGEKVISVIHRDAFIAVKVVLLFTILLVMPFIIIAMLTGLFPNLTQTVMAWPLLLVCASAYLLFVWLLFFFSLIDYFLDIWVITDNRIINVIQNGFFSRSIAEVRLDRIQDVTSETHGFFQTFLKYGNVIVQTASEKDPIFFEEVANPEGIRDLLVRLTEDKHKVSQAPNP